MESGKRKRIVFKVGSSLLVENECIAQSRIHALCELIADLSHEYEVILVTSGAVAAGYTESKLDKRNLPNKQALASLGQPLLMHMYYCEFRKFDLYCAQLLLCAGDFDSRKRTVNACNAIEVLLKNNMIPVINENDAVAVGELVFGDNDRLSAHVTHFFDASLLVIFSDIDGYYDSNPKENPNAKILQTVHTISPGELHADATPNNEFATGGIVTKLQAAQFLLEHGRSMYLASGFDLPTTREYLLHGVQKSGTLFAPRE